MNERIARTTRGDNATRSGPAARATLERHERTLRLDIANPVTGSVPSSVDEAVRSEGEPIEASARRTLESRFQYDFNHVRVHSDREANSAATVLGARAFAFGNHIVFGAGEYTPQSPSGAKLLAHELAHVVQQTGERNQQCHQHSDDRLERSADDAAEAAMSGHVPVVISEASPLRVARTPNPQRPSRNFEGATMITVELPLGSASAERLGYEKDFHGYLPSNIVEDDAKWHASHAVGPGGMGIEREEGILLAPRGVNLSVQKNLENQIARIREIAPKGSKLTMKIETGAHPGTRRLAFINYELHVTEPSGASGPILTASVNVGSDVVKPTVDVSVGHSFVSEAARRYEDAFNIRKESGSGGTKGGPLRPRSSEPATYSSSASTTKRYEVPKPEVVQRRPPLAQGGSPPQPQSSGSTSPASPPTSVAGAPGAPSRTTSTQGSVPTQTSGGQPGGATHPVGAQGQRVYGGAPSRPIDVPQSSQAAARGAAAMALMAAMDKLGEIGKAVQDKDARTKLLSVRQEIIDVLNREPGIGAVIELQFLEPEHRFQDIYWARTTAANAGKPTIVANPEARQPTSTFIYIEPMRSAKAGATPVGPVPKEAKSGQEFIMLYGQARGADLVGASTGMIAVEMYDAVQHGNRQFGYTDVRAGIDTIRISDAALSTIEAAVAGLAERNIRRRLTRLKGGIDAQQARLSEKMKDWFGGAIKLNGHELDPARAHFAAAENYARDKKYGPASESIDAGDAQVEEVWAALYEYDNGHRPVAPLIW